MIFGQNRRFQSLYIIGIVCEVMHLIKILSGREAAVEAETSFEQVYSRYRGRLYSLAYKILRSREDAEDALSTVFMRASRQWQRLADMDEDKQKNYLIVAVEHAAYDIIRAQNRRNEVAIEEWMADDGAEIQAEDEVTKCILELPEKYRSVILLKYCDGYPVKEIAKILGISASTVSKRDKTGKELLEKMCIERGLL